MKLKVVWSGACGNFAKVEIVGSLRRKIACQGFKRSSPHSRQHVYHKSEREDGKYYSLDAQFVYGGIVGCPDFSQEVEPEERKDHYPECQKDFSVEDAPMVNLVGDTEELKGQRELQEA